MPITTKQNRHRHRSVRRVLGAPSGLRQQRLRLYGDPHTTGRAETASERKHRKRAERRNTAKPPVDPMEAVGRLQSRFAEVGEALEKLTVTAEEASQSLGAFHEPFETHDAVAHTLREEGAPFNSHGKRIGKTGTAGEGRAKCACGELSEILPSRNKRREWHREHKEAS